MYLKMLLSLFYYEILVIICKPIKYSVLMFKYFYFKCLKNSQITMPAVTLTLSECLVPN